MNATLVRGSDVRHCSRKFPGFTRHKSRIRHRGINRWPSGHARTRSPSHLLSVHHRPRRPGHSSSGQASARRSPGRADCGRARAPTGLPNRGLPTTLADRTAPGNRAATGPLPARIAIPDRHHAAAPRPAGSARVQVSGDGRGPATRPARRPGRGRAAARDPAGPVPSPPAPPAGPVRDSGSTPSTAPRDRYVDTPGSAARTGSGRIRDTTSSRAGDIPRIRTVRPDPAVSA